MPRPKNPTLPRKVIESQSAPPKTRGVYANVELEPVPFDPTVDCAPFACFNCRVLDAHLNKDCSKSVLHKYCKNCGRRGLDVYECPRCSKGYIQQFGQKLYMANKVKQSVVEVPQKVEKKLPVGMTPLPKSTKKKRAKKSSSSSSQGSSEKNLVVTKRSSLSISDSPLESELGDKSFSDVDEDLDNMVFDESETPLEQQDKKDEVQTLMILLEATKDLSLEDQSRIIMGFVEAQKS